MRKKIYGILIVLLLPVLVVVLNAYIFSSNTTYNVNGELDGSKYEKKWDGQDGQDFMEATFEEFNGVRVTKVFTKPGDEIELKYDFEINEGSLKIVLVSPWKRILKEQEFDTDGDGKIVYTSKSFGHHIFYVIGKKATGSFNVSWEKR